MEKVTVFTTKKERTRLCHGTREVLVLESEHPVCECAAAQHARDISKELFAHARRVHFPQAAAELEALVGAGRGFAFARHRLQFAARLSRDGTGLCMSCTLRYTVGAQVKMRQSVQSFWDESGTYRRAPKKRRKTKKVDE